MMQALQVLALWEDCQSATGTLILDCSEQAVACCPSAADYCH